MSRSAPGNILEGRVTYQHYANPASLIDLDTTPDPALQGVASISGNVLTIEPQDDYTGQFEVYVTASDSIETVSDAFNVSVTDEAPAQSMMTINLAQDANRGGGLKQSAMLGRSEQLRPEIVQADSDQVDETRELASANAAPDIVKIQRCDVLADAGASVTVRLESVQEERRSDATPERTVGQEPRIVRNDVQAAESERLEAEQEDDYANDGLTDTLAQCDLLADAQDQLAMVL